MKEAKNNVSLDLIMAYQHEGLVSRLQDKYNLSQEDAIELFDDTKRFLYLATVTGEAISPPKNIDNGWHEFILFTQDYAQFCYNLLGQFIHHAPNLDNQKPSTNSLSFKQFVDKFLGGVFSKNWVGASGDCAPTSNCEKPPNDCAVNHAGFAWPRT